MSVNRARIVTLGGKKESIRGDKLRDLIFLVYLNNRYGLGKKIRISKLKQYLGYSTGGLYNALDDSGFFIRKGDDIVLSKLGEKYAKKELLQPYKAFFPVSYLFIIFGIILIVQWYLLAYHNVLLRFDWTTGFAFIITGFFLRFALLPFAYWFLKLQKKV